jgi:phosphatidylserine synthase
VTAAICLLWLSLILAFAQRLLFLIQDPQIRPRFYLGFTIILAVAVAWFYCIQVGQNWARILVLIVSVAVLFLALKLHRIHTVLDALPLSLRLVASLLLFSAPANAWFRDARKPPPPVQAEQLEQA